MINIPEVIKKFQSLNLFRKIFIIGFTSIILSFGMLSIIKIFQYSENSVELKIFFVIGIIVSFLFFLYLSVYDIVKYEIPGSISMIFPIVLLIINIILGLAIGFETRFSTWDLNSTTPLLNIAGGLISALIIGAIVFLTKENGMGEGDIWVIASLGFFVGAEKMVIGFYLSIFSALLIGILYSIKLKKFKGVPVPLVPFLVFGSLAAFVFALHYRMIFLI